MAEVNKILKRLETQTTERGFKFIKFDDLYGENCSIQKSSLATEDTIWLGIDDAKPQIMANDAKKLGIETDETTGWIPYLVPNEVLMTTRMHLSQRMVKEMLPYLIEFVETGDIS